MAKDILNYENMVERALRSVVIDALVQASEFGLPGTHHLYITFATDASEVEIPDRLREKFPEEMTIVLQHQFWDLTINDHKFSVILSFNGKKKNISVPFNSITSFSDPSVGFSLQFKKDLLKEKKISSNKLIEKKNQKFKAEIFSLDAFRSKKED